MRLTQAVCESGVPLTIMCERHAFDFAVIPQMRSAVPQAQPDSLWTNNYKAHLLVRLTGLHKTTPWLAFPHGYTTSDLKVRLYNQLDRWSLRVPRRVLTVCTAFACDLAQKGVPSQKILLQPLPIRPIELPPPEELPRLRRELGLRNETALLVSIGRLSREKGHGDLVRAMAVLRERAPRLDCCLLVIGDGPEYASLSRLSRALGLTGQIRLIGDKPDIRSHLALADALVLPSYRMLLEALSAGIPVVATSLGGVPEIVKNENHLLLVEPRDIAGLSDALQRILRAAPLRERSSSCSPVVAARSAEACYRFLLKNLLEVTLPSQAATKGGDASSSTAVQESHPCSRASALPRPVPILLFVRELNHGGIERDVAKLAMWLDRSRFEPHVACYSPRGMRYEDLRAAGVPILPLPVSAVVSRSAISAAFPLRRYIALHQIRIVHAFDPSATFAVPLSRILGVPVVMSSQLGSRSLNSSWTRRLMRLTDRLVDAVVVNCEAMRRHLVEDEHVPPERILLCRNGVDTSEFYPSRTPGPHRPPDAQVVIGVVAVLRPEKALHVLQEAFARLAGDSPRKKLVFVGGGPELDRLRTNAARLGIEPCSLFVPSTTDVAGWLRSMDIFVLPSILEAFPNAMLEAMACGCAVIGSRVGGIPELIGDEERGLLARPGDAVGLADKINCLINNEDLRRELGARAASFAAEHLTMENNAARAAHIYDQLLSQKSPRYGRRTGRKP